MKLKNVLFRIGLLLGALLLLWLGTRYQSTFLSVFGLFAMTTLISITLLLFDGYRNALTWAVNVVPGLKFFDSLSAWWFLPIGVVFFTPLLFALGVITWAFLVSFGVFFKDPIYKAND